LRTKRERNKKKSFDVRRGERLSANLSKPASFIDCVDFIYLFIIFSLLPLFLFCFVLPSLLIWSFICLAACSHRITSGARKLARKSDEREIEKIQKAVRKKRKDKRIGKTIEGCIITRLIGTRSF
jgi:hypothetical protein